MKLALLLALPIAASASAQPPILTAETDVGVIYSGAGQTSSQLIAATTIIDEPTGAETDNTLSSSAFTSALPQGNRILLFETGASVTRFGSAVIDLGTTRSGTQTEPHSWTWTFTGARQGALIGSWVTLLEGTNAETRVEIDVDADGTVEFAAAGAQFATVRIPVARPNGFAVRVTTLARIRQSSPQVEAYSSSLELAWVAASEVPPVRILPTDNGFLATSCGPELWLGDVPIALDHGLTWSVRGAAAGAPAALFLGFVPLFVQIPGSGCYLETDPIVVLPQTTDATGRAAWMARVPGPVRNAQLYSQILSVDPTLGVRTSNALRVVFED